MNYRFFAYLFIAIILGIILGTFCSFALAIALGFAFISIIFLKKRLLAILALSMAIFVFITSFTYPRAQKKYVDVTISGTVTEVIESDFRTTFLIENCDHKELRKFKIYANLQGYEYCGYKIKEGNYITVRGKATPQNGRTLEFYEQFYIEEDSYWFDAYEYSIKDNKENVRAFLKNLKTKVRNTIFLNIEDSKSATILYAMISGDKHYIDASVKDAFNKCGLSHLLAVSGLHVGIILGVVVFMLKRIRLKKFLMLILMGVFLIFYVIFTGEPSSVIRAALMAIVMQIGLKEGLKYNGVNSLSFAGCCILALEPFRLYDIGFQLSFLACFGIMWISRYFVNKYPNFINSIINAALVSLGATLGALPIQMYYFRTLSSVSLIANVLFVTIASFALTLTFIFLISALICAPLGFLLKIPGAIMSGIINEVNYLSDAPIFEFRQMPFIMVISLLIIFVFFTRFVHVKKRAFAGILLIILPILLVGKAVFYENYVRATVVNYSNVKGFVHIEDGKHYIIGIADENIGGQADYIRRNMGKADAVILTDEKDVKNISLAVDNGLAYDKLYVTPDIDIDVNLKKLGAEKFTDIHCKEGRISFSPILYYRYKDDKVRLTWLRRSESHITYLRS